MNLFDRFIRKRSPFVISVVDPLDEQIKKLGSFTSQAIADKVKVCLANCLVEANAKAELALGDLCPHSAYESPPSSDFGVLILVVPCTLQEARNYYLRQHPSIGFLGFVQEALRQPIMEIERTVRGKKGVIFVIVCIAPKKRWQSVNLGLCPISKEFGDSVPLVLPLELMPETTGGEGTHQVP